MSQADEDFKLLYLQFVDGYLFHLNYRSIPGAEITLGGSSARLTERGVTVQADREGGGGGELVWLGGHHRMTAVLGTMR